MWCLLTILISLVLGIIAGVMTDKREYERWLPVTIPLCVVFFVYGGVGLFLYVCKDDAKREYERYMMAKSECELLKTDAEVSVETVTHFKEHIDSMNKRIRLTKKYKDHWYMKNFVNEETALLEPLNYDTINVKIILN